MNRISSAYQLRGLFCNYKPIWSRDESVFPHILLSYQNICWHRNIQWLKTIEPSANSWTCSSAWRGCVNPSQNANNLSLWTYLLQQTCTSSRQTCLLQTHWGASWASANPGVRTGEVSSLGFQHSSSLMLGYKLQVWTMENLEATVVSFLTSARNVYKAFFMALLLLTDRLCYLAIPPCSHAQENFL